jgi:two-component system, OmpR family, response regulator
MQRALIIDDEIDICYLLSGILRAKHLQVNYVNTLSEATLALQTQNPEIIFLDNHLPDGLGVDFIKHIKEIHPNTKVVMISAFDNFLDRYKANNNGVDSFVGKPFSKGIIFEAVDALLKN